MCKQFKIIIFCLIMLVGQYLYAMPPPARFSAKFPVFSKDNSKLIYLRFQNHGRAFNIIHMNNRTGKIIKNIAVKGTSDLTPFAATTDGFKILAMSPHGIGVIHNGTGKLLRTLPYPSKINDWRFKPVQSHDGVLLAIPSVGQQSQQIYLTHTGSGKIIRSIPISKENSSNSLPIIRSIGFNHDRHRVAYLQSDDKKSIMHIYDIYLKKEILSMKMPQPYYNYGGISFSQNGQYLLFHSHAKKGIVLLDLQKKTAKTLHYDFSSFASFTKDNKKIIIIQPFLNRISIENIATGVAKIIAFKFKKREGEFATNVIQSADKKLLALPFETFNVKKIDRFLLLDGNTGKYIREIAAVIEK